MLAFKVWSKDRAHKVAVTAEEQSSSLLSDVISAASNKLKFPGSQLVLESDGTMIDDNFLLLHWRTEVFMLLNDDEIWSAAVASTSNCSDEQSSASISCDDKNKSNNSSNNDLETSPPPIMKITNMYELEKMQIAWEKFDADTLQKIKHNCDKLNQKQKNSVIRRSVQYVVQQIRRYSDHPTTAVMKCFAKQMCQTYPIVFEDRLPCGKTQGLGYTSLMQKLGEHNRYLNRPHMKKSLSRELKLSLQNNKKIKAIKAGSVQWQPNYENEEQENNIEKYRQLLLNFEDDSTEEFNEMNNYFKQTFPAQRLFLNNENTPTAAEILETWPCLFSIYYSQQHFFYLTGYMITDLRSSFNDCSEKILMYQHKSSENMDDEKKKWEVLYAIFHRFKEDINNLFTIVPSDQRNGIPNHHDYPHIIVFQDTLNSKDNDDKVQEEAERSSFLVVVDKLAAYPEVQDIIDALQLLMSSYFNFNRTYPKDCSCFLEFVQRMFLGIFPFEASRSNSTETVTKVNRFVQKLHTIET